ncbi:polysaccharide pyruvyl transferase family protein [Postechiella marina]|uniref:Polysaccharide pyruvyl transferase family protein n=1 Tax=Postechiella marina TaxID=943941 RepID=A0ABP8C1S2_9FLAO
MKIGILTLPLHKNYGGLLQAYALQKHLKDLGHDAHLIDIKHKQSEQSLSLKIKIYIYNLINGKSHLKKYQPKVEAPVHDFNNRYIQPKTKIINTPEKLEELNNMGFNAIIVGSDQVWRLEYSSDLKYNYFLDFITNTSIKKISYAASYGKAIWEDHSIINEVKSLLKKFNSISVREDSAQDLTKNLFEVDAEHVLDPTMLISKAQYIELIEQENTPDSKGTLLEYFLDENDLKLSVSSQIAKLYKLKPFTVNGKNISKMPISKLKTYKYPSVFEWIKGFHDAKYVVTDSFHGTVFCIIFNKQFISIGNKSRGVTRFSSLLKKFNLENRLVLSAEDVNSNLLNTKINYDEVNKILEEQKKLSTSFLVKSLNV